MNIEQKGLGLYPRPLLEIYYNASSQRLSEDENVRVPLQQLALRGGNEMKNKTNRLLLLFIAVLLLSSCSNSQTSIQLGNSASNISAGSGLVMERDGWIFYSTRHGLYKTKDDFRTIYKLNNTHGYSINVYDGWVYYIQPVETDSFHYFPAETNVLRKMKIDGSQDQSLNAENVLKMIVINDWIYYQPSDTNQLFRMKLDGSSNTVVIKERSMLPVSDGKRLYCAIRGDNPGIFQFNTDGTLAEKLSDAITFSYDIGDNWLYYSKIDEGYRLYRVSLDGKQEEPFKNINTYLFVIRDQYMYYISYSSSEFIASDLHRYNFQADEDQILRENVQTFNIAGDWIYLEDTSFTQNSQITIPYRIHLDGSGFELTP